MRTQEAKAIPLEILLTRMGYAPHHQVRDDLWYISPLREEREASFKIETGQNVWFDYGIWQGGNNLDYIRHHFSIPEHDIPAMLRRIESIMGRYRVSDVTVPEPTSKASPEGTKRDIGKAEPLRNQALIGYLRKRGISIVTARPYLKEVYWTHKGKRYFALAFATETESGYELRNAYYKGTEGRKNISVVKPTPTTEKILTDEKRVQGQAVTVFEGFMDFLSALEYYQKPIKTPVIVMNGVGMRYRTLDAIAGLEGIKKVYLYLDRDEQGRETSAFLEKALSARCTVLDKSDLYDGYEDFNALLAARKTASRSPEHHPS